ncbi:leucine-rich repeat-containing protein 56 isoform X3 [Castor canadensis]|uniref:Leucine-rich repeat-containing protein 56 isoform X3 n=1 Tax=Castor canadensis TaxID=51338 RepID=A0AC58KT35_CASCN
MWMDPAWGGSQRPQPGTASVRVRELSWQGQHNPSPNSKGLGCCGSIRRERLVEEHLSPARLQALAKVEDLRLVRVLEMCVDTRENSLGNFAVHLPNLNQLKLNGSRLGSIRDLGTSLGRLQVLWLARCGLTDLDGISSFPALKELYVSYNNISDLSSLCLLEQLEVLDLEGNCVDDLGQVRYLQLCPRLVTLTLEGNLVCLRPAPGPSNKALQGYNYRAEVRKLIPQLHTLDEVPATRTDLPHSRKLSQDWLMVKEAIKESSLLDSLLPRLDHSHGATMRKLDPVLSLPETQPGSLSLLVPGGRLPEGLLPEDPVPEDHASNLTHGHSRTLGSHLIPSPPKYPMTPDSGSISPRGSVDLPFRGRRLRGLGSLGPSLGEGPGLGERLAAVTSLRALEVSSGPSPRAQGCPDTKPAPAPAARPPGLHCLCHLNPIPSAHSQP